MAALVNDPEAHTPHGPRLGRAYEGIGNIEPQNFYQPFDEGQRRRAEEFASRVEQSSDHAVPIDEYQAWCEMNWKEPHGTIASAERSTSKLTEEVQELLEEIHTGRSKENLISELGDVLWCTAAIASDLRINIKHGLKMLLDKYGHYIRNFEDGSVPHWVKSAQTLTFDDGLSAAGIDSMIDSGYESQEAAIMLVDDPGEITQVEINDALTHLDINSRLLRSITLTNYEKDLYQTGAIYQAEAAEYLTARIFVDIAFLAKHTAGSSLTEVIGHNVQKLSSRVSDDRVDKSDGDRS